MEYGFAEMNDERNAKEWDKLYQEYHFVPSIHDNGEAWIQLPEPKSVYRLTQCWSDEQEAIVNEIFKSVVKEHKELLRLEWHHDGYLYHPHQIEVKEWIKEYGAVYYPDGEYCFHVTQDYRMGIFGHPWRKELIVVGENLIREFEKHKEKLLLQ